MPVGILFGKDADLFRIVGETELEAERMGEGERKREFP
jgi:hypothetical protein